NHSALPSGVPEWRRGVDQRADPGRGVRRLDHLAGLGCGTVRRRRRRGAHPPRHLRPRAHLRAGASRRLVTHTLSWSPALSVPGARLSLLVAAVRVATLGLLPIVPTLNLAVIGCFVTFPLTVAFAASSLGLCRRAAGLAAV